MSLGRSEWRGLFGSLLRLPESSVYARIDDDPPSNASAQALSSLGRTAPYRDDQTGAPASSNHAHLHTESAYEDPFQAGEPVERLDTSTVSERRQRVSTEDGLGDDHAPPISMMFERDSPARGRPVTRGDITPSAAASSPSIDRAADSTTLPGAIDLASSPRSSSAGSRAADASRSPARTAANDTMKASSSSGTISPTSSPPPEFTRVAEPPRQLGNSPLLRSPGLRQVIGLASPGKRPTPVQRTSSTKNSEGRHSDMPIHGTESIIPQNAKHSYPIVIQSILNPAADIRQTGGNRIRLLDEDMHQKPSGRDKGKGRSGDASHLPLHRLDAYHDEEEDAAGTGHPTFLGAPLSRAFTSRPWSDSGNDSAQRRAKSALSAKEKALWQWVNVIDIDANLQEIYAYYNGKGLRAIALSHLLNLLTIGFVITFTSFLLGCIDHTRLRTSHSLQEVMVSQCLSKTHGSSLLIVLGLASFYATRIYRFTAAMKRLLAMRNFYEHLLCIPEADIPTVPWPTIVTRIAALRADHPVALSSRTQAENDNDERADRLDAHDVANRIMRLENYLVALFNSDILDLSISLPASLGQRKLGGQLTKSLEWNLRFCLLGFLVGDDGLVRRAFVNERNRQDLSEALKRRFILVAVINSMLWPFIVLYLLFYSFFRYFEEYHKNPSSIGSRSYTQLARWKFREYNELPHNFQQRLHRSYPAAEMYVEQFPKELTSQIARFVAFVSGSFASVLVLFSLLDPDAFLHFEVTPGRTVLFYIGVFGGILAVARGMVPDDHQIVDPEELMLAIIECTHYCPPEWKDQLHSAEVHREFSQLFQMRVTTFVLEMISVVTTPYVLWRNLPKTAPAIVDFFRETTIHVDGLGYVCASAVFDSKGKSAPTLQLPNGGEEHHRWPSDHGKMEKSLISFKSTHPDWMPHDQATSLFLSRMTEGSTAPISSNLYSSGLASAPTRRQFAAGRSILRGSRYVNAPVSARSAESAPSHHSFSGPISTKEKVREAKARLYDRAYQNSVLKAAKSSSLPSNKLGSTQRIAPPGVSFAIGESIAEEPSSLDGSYLSTDLQDDTNSQSPSADPKPPQSMITLLNQMYDEGARKI
ncbi:uncharacterized protein L969DRAFT_102683 [Mixia osmundae IAM 14324]|uniref:Autophagy-related protein 9 n=1 Tax=Mixia osmundae (strain CBS 9802 / IAM 14324 / JCM 22182 / KY 12970) TaxID=764103 RepID=G7E9J0_MIXOS|nr:uncharacterized protein L969DRAFT_102683 [Mixia osmundae IAM 14324]KEI39941.1 hypothetical protein L969DRAFT_102683 [Mixia osmundae IAM 14324]GAA99309.1 hypothetical protein E5Q_06004 [Mixia osmundae IAM 14324]